MNLHNAEFIKSAASAQSFIRDDRPEIVFAGRSNVGKSSLINKLLNRKNFARVGSAPGKTAHVNYFLIDDSAYFVDLPGYGYAKVSKAERDRWAELMEAFFACGRITLGVLIVDARHKPTADDCTMCDWFKLSSCPFVVAANKTDKLKAKELAANIHLISETLALDDAAAIIPVSAEKGTGRDELLNVILQYC
ncbi:MAG: ribosome biogenesis GTP-binding protein YihA/YsxC [Oscillospiraceae bacterium]|nr:ribosome biogenesis GTP-binding protein YihA/YsxC [Oscillospiraceae bacterium]